MIDADEDELTYEQLMADDEFWKPYRLLARYNHALRLSTRRSSESAFLGHPHFGRITKILSGMKQRCYNQDSVSFRWYGERGIEICDEWLTDMDLFIGWSLENGYAPGLTLDRIDNYQGYSPGNVRWVTMEENNKNKRCHQDAREAAALATIIPGKH